MANVLTWAKDTANYLLYGPGANTSPSRKNTGPLLTESSPIRTSYVFDSHIVSESASSGKSKNPQTLSLAYDERERYGLDAASKSWQGMTPLERKETLIGIYLANPWVGACIDVIANRICSGGFVIEPVEEGKGNKTHYDQLQEFCLRVNDDWDLLQYVRSSLVDLLIFGETYTEITWKSGLPYQLFSVDCLTMHFKQDRYGRILDFYQQMPSDMQKHSLGIDNIIRWWRPHPRAKIDPFSPIEKIQDAIFLAKTMVNWQQQFFKRGAKFDYYLKGVGEASEAERYKQYWQENYTGNKNAHTIPILWGDAELVPLGNQGALQLDFDKGEDKQRTIVFAGFQVPPAAVSIIESGNIGGGTGEDQDKSLQNNACDPLKNAFLEKFNWRIVNQGFKITDYKIGLRYAEYRSDEQIAKVQDVRVKNGTRTIDELRQEDGKKPYKIGGSVPFVWSTKEMTPVPRLADLENESRQNAQVALDTAKANADLAKEKVKQAQKPPEPDNKMLGDGDNKSAGTPPEKPDKGLGDNKQKEESQQQQTGVMVAFMLDSSTADQLALSGGEDPDQLHITLAFLGDMTNWFFMVPSALIDLQRVVEQFAIGQNPLQGKIAGLGRFQAPDGQPDPVIALPDIPGLAEFRQALVYRLIENGIDVSQDHGYTPHVTLAYIDKSADMPLRSVENVPLYFDSICLAVGGERFSYPLLGQKAESVEEAIPDASHSPVPDNLWVRPDIDQEIARLREQGVVSVQWKDHPGSCEMCQLNAGHTVALGETFPSGHQLPPAHPNCICPVAFIHEDGSVEIEKDREDPNALQTVNDPDITQSMKAVNIKRTVSSRRE